MRKKNTLYTANKWNQGLFVPENLFDDGGSTGSTGATGTGTNTGGGSNVNAGQIMGMINGQGGSGKGNFWMSMLKGAAQVGSTPFTVDGIEYKRGVYDATDPFYKAGNTTFADGSKGHKENKIGNALSDQGVNLFQSSVQNGDVYGMLTGAVFKSAGDFVNNAWGMAYNKEAIGQIEQNSNTARRFGSMIGQAETNNDLLDASGFMATSSGYDSPSDLVKGGVFKKNSARRQGQKYLDMEKSALGFQGHALQTSVDNVDRQNDSNVMREFFALGGPLGNPGGVVANGYNDNNGMGAIGYDFMDRYLTTKEKQANNKNQMTNMFMGMPSSMVDLGGNAPSTMALGGVLQAHGSDFSTGLTHVDAGKSHEENPNDGVQMGVDGQGVPNLVEENETVWNDYVFSNRILADEATKQMFKLPKKKDVTFADISKKLEKEIQERPNDPISRSGFEAQMQKLEEEQERQKAEMEAARAREAFETLSDEEKVAVMQELSARENLAAQAEMEQAAAQQQPTEPSPEEVAMMEQQQVAQPEVIEQPVMAEGGHLFPWGGVKELFNVKPPYAASRTAGFIPYTRDLNEEEVIKREGDPVFQAWTKYVNDNWDTEEVQNYLRALDAAAGGNHLFDKEGKIVEGAKDYYNHARTGNHKWGYYHLTPEQLAEEAIKEKAATAKREPRVFHALEGDDDYIQGKLDPNTVGLETRRVTLDNGDTVIYHDRIPNKGKSPSEVAAETGLGTDGEDGDGKKPVYRPEWMRYAGLLGPAVGLGMMAAGVGRPNTKELDAALDSYDKTGTAMADYQPIGDYLTYRPMDIWFEQNRMNANARATDRALLNSSSPARMAGLLANGYNSQIASGDLYRKALEYNDALRERTATFNRGTNQFNAEAYNRAALANAQSKNASRGARASLAAQIASQKMDADAGWYNSLYANVGNLFKGIGDMGRENAQWNMIADSAADGVYGNLGDSYTSRRWTRPAANGGKLKKGKKGKKGLTY